MMKTLLAALALAATVAVGGKAEDYGVKFWRTNGDSVCVAFSQNPSVYLRGGKIEIAADGLNLKVAIDEVSKWTFYTIDPSGINIPSAEGGVCIRLGDGLALISGLAQGAKVSLFTADGRRIASATADASGQARLDIGALGRAVYILQAGRQTVKFIKN